MATLEPLPPDWLLWNAARLEEEIRVHNRNYWKLNEPTISDPDYDRLVERLRELNPESPLLDSLGEETLFEDGATAAEEGQPGDKVHHEVAMLSLGKAYHDVTVQNWAKKFSGSLVMSPKIDGLACSIRYDGNGHLVLASTRGDGQVGEDVTANARKIETIPETLPLDRLPAELQTGEPIEVRGEVYLKVSEFKRVNKVLSSQGKDTFANPRNLAAGTLKQKNADADVQVALSFFAYDLIGLQPKDEMEKLAICESLGFTSVEHRLIERDGISAGYAEYIERRSKLDYEIDGVVFKANALDVQQSMGFTAHHPRYAIAYKLQGDSAVTILREVKWSLGRTGVLTPVGHIDQVKLSGANVRKVSLHNWGWIESHNLTLGAEVVVVRSGGVIPYLELAVKPGDKPIEKPKVCPSCGKPTIEDGDFIKCAEKCDGQLLGVLEYFTKNTGIRGFGRKRLSVLIKEKLLNSPADFYKLTPEKLEKVSLAENKEKSAKKTKDENAAVENAENVTSVDKSKESENEKKKELLLEKKLCKSIDKTRKLKISTFLAALGLSNVGKTVAISIARRFLSLEAIRQASVQDMESIDKVGNVLAKSIVESLAEKSELCDELLKYITLLPMSESDELTDISFCFTGTLTSMKREDAEARVVAMGGTCTSSVSETLDYLVLGSTGRAGAKLDKARLLEKEDKVKIISESEFLELIRKKPAMPMLVEGELFASAQSVSEPEVSDLKTETADFEVAQTDVSVTETHAESADTLEVSDLKAETADFEVAQTDASVTEVHTESAEVLEVKEEAATENSAIEPEVSDLKAETADFEVAQTDASVTEVHTESAEVLEVKKEAGTENSAIEPELLDLKAETADFEVVQSEELVTEVQAEFAEALDIQDELAEGSDAVPFQLELSPAKKARAARAKSSAPRKTPVKAKAADLLTIDFIAQLEAASHSKSRRKAHAVAPIDDAVARTGELFPHLPHLPVPITPEPPVKSKTSRAKPKTPVVDEAERLTGDLFDFASYLDPAELAANDEAREQSCESLLHTKSESASNTPTESDTLFKLE